MRALVVLVALPATAAAEPARFVPAARIGLAATSRESDFRGDLEVPTGKGLWFDGELGVRAGDTTVAAFAGYVRGFDRPATPEYGPATIGDVLLDFGVRVVAHSGPIRSGAGVGLEYEQIVVNGVSRTTATHPLAELDTGYTFGALGGVSPQLALVFTVSGAEGSTDASARVALGVQF